MSDHQIEQLLQALGALASEVAGLRADLAELRGEQAGQQRICDLQIERVDRIEAAVGRQGLVATILGAVGGAIVLAISAFSKGGGS